MNFLVDNQLPVALAAFLRERGHRAEHALDLHLEESDDRAIWKEAMERDAVPVSKDEDFVYLSNAEAQPCRLVWVRLGNCRNAALINAFARSIDRVVQLFDEGQRIVELR